jgi:hypothetical protein
MQIALIVVLTVVLLAVLLAVQWWRSRPAPRLGSFKQGDFCYPCASPIDAQFGSRLYIAGKANVAGAQRRFFLHNTSGQTMTVKSFTFGGYKRKFGQVTEMILPNLMQQYGYSDTVAPGGVFSLDPDNDSHVMYKGWYNGPLFIAYCLGAETADTQYTVLGWAPMRLQDETVEYKYFYDAALKADLLAKTPPEEQKAYQQMLGQQRTYRLARNAAVHWETGAAPGQARALRTISTDAASQCSWVTTVNTFEAVNVRVPLAHLGVRFLLDPTRGNSRADCLRQIATIGSALIMDSSADLDNFMVEPSEWMPILVTSIATALWFYVELGAIALNVVAIVLNLAPGVGFALSFSYDMTVMAIKTFSSSGVLSMVPGIGEQLNEIGVQFANGNAITDIASPFLSVLDAGTAAAAGNFKKGAEVAIKAGVKAAVKKGIQIAAREVMKLGVKKLAEKFPEIGDVAGPLLVTIFTIAIDMAVDKGFSLADSRGEFTEEEVLKLLEQGIRDDADNALKGDLKKVWKDLLDGQYQGAALEIAMIINDKKEELLEKGLRMSTEQVITLIGQQIAVGTSQVAPPSGEGAGKEKWKPGTPGRDGYALKRKLWVNREMQKGKFAQDAACSGNWEVTYFDAESRPAGPSDDGCTIM